MEDEMTAGSITTDEATKRDLAQKSKAFNAKDPTFRELFPDLCEDAAKEETVEAEAEPVDMSTEAVEPPAPTNMVGKEAVLGGLKAEVYNGRKVVVESWDAEADRLQVRLQDDKTLIRVRVDNLVST